MADLDLTGRRALVTGGAHGLGEGMAQALAAAGARVVIGDLQDDLGAKVAGVARRRPRVRPPRRHRRRQLGGRRRRRGRPARRPRHPRQQRRASRSPAAGRHRRRRRPREMLEVNVLGTALGIKHAFRAMRPGGAAGNGGAIINIASVAATIAFPGIAVYSATKSAVDRLTRVAADGVRQARLRRAGQLRLPRPRARPTMGVATRRRHAPSSACSAQPDAGGRRRRRAHPARPARRGRRHGRRGGLPRLRRVPGSSPASACRSTAEWGCDHEHRQARRRLRRLRLHRPADLRVPARVQRPVHRRRPRQGPDPGRSSTAIPGLETVRARGRRGRAHASRRSPSCSPVRAVVCNTGRPVHQVTARRSSRRAWRPVATTWTPPASRTG